MLCLRPSIFLFPGGISSPLYPHPHIPKIYCKFYISRWYFSDSGRWNCPGRGYPLPMYHRPARIYCKFYISWWYFLDSGKEDSRWGYSPSMYHRPTKIQCKIYISWWYFLDSRKEDSRWGYSPPNIIAPPKSIVNFTFPDDTFPIQIPSKSNKRTQGKDTLSHQ